MLSKSPSVKYLLDTSIVLIPIFPKKKKKKKEKAKKAEPREEITDSESTITAPAYFKAT